MHRSGRFVRCATMLVAASLLAAWAACGLGPAHAQVPDFSDVDDVLLGRRLVLPIQDLVLALNGDSAFASNENLILEMNDSDFPPNPGLPSYSPGGTPLALASGRMFDLPNDVLVTLSRGASSATTAVLNVYDPLGNQAQNIPLPASVCAPSETCAPNSVALGDLTGDGYAEAVIGYSGGGIQVASAADVGDFAQGLELGDLFEGSPTVAAQALAVEDLDADGRSEIAVVSLPQFQVYTLVPPTNPDDPSLDLELASSMTFNPEGASTASFELEPGQFDDDTQDRELVLAYNAPDGVVLSLVEIAPDLTASIGDAQDLDFSGPSFALAIGRLDWFGDSDQIVLLAGDGVDAATLTLAVVAKDEDAFVTQSTASIAPPGGLCLSDTPQAADGVALGDFDFDLQNPESTPPNLEIAALFDCFDNLESEYAINIYTVDPSNDFALSFVRTRAAIVNALPPSALSIVTSDTQGRSLLLGPPQKVTINQHSQPRIVMGAPPMHIDYVQDPAGSSASFDVVNMTAFPATDQSSVRGMDSAFEVASSSQVTNQSTQTTSYSFSVTQGTGANVSFGDPDVGTIGIATKSIATTTHDHMIQNKFGTYDNFSYDINTISGFGDVVWFDSKRFNIWTYRVLGHFACPAETPDCDSQRPLQMTFSGPDEIIPQPHTPGTAVEWYQPYHEVGNILSYPQNLTQLETTLESAAGFENFFEESFTTGSNDDTETLNWQEGDNSAKSTGYVKTHTRQKSESVSVSAALSDFGIGGGASVSYSENSSESFSTLNTTVETMASTNGFTISVPGFNFGEDYSYPFDGFILGDAANPNVVQTELLDDLKDKVDLTVNGTLRLAFVAQPDQAGGAWWANGTAPYLSAPDVALNHPFRWSLLTESSGPLSSVYCFNVLDRDNVQDGGGYQIKGLFVLPEGAASGPQLTVADEGETLQLQALVYNYSRLDMDQASPAVTQVKVQFYGQEWDASTQEFTGDAFLIDEVPLDPIPGNNANNQNLNSALASTTFDTGTCPLEGGCGGKYLKFWLVVWMEDAEGNLVADYQDHGLTTAPVTPFTSICQVNVEPISNNVGYYDQEIYVCPEGEQCTVPPDDSAAAALALDEVTVSTDQAATFESWR